MTNRQPILYLAIALFLVCAYHLSFTWKVRSVEKEANLHAENVIEDEKINAINAVNLYFQSKIDDLDSTQIRKIQEVNEKFSDSIASIETQYTNFRDTIIDALAKDYISSMSTNGSDDKIFLGMYTYQECKQREINLGLDLQGGMSVTLEMSVEDVLKNLAKDKDPNFRSALKVMVDKKNESSMLTRDLLETFKDNYDGDLIDAFYDKSNKRRFKAGSTDDEVIRKLNIEVNSAVEATFNVIRNRIDRFGVTQPNIQKLDNFPQSRRLLVELPGIKNAKRARKLLQAAAQLEFWEVYQAGDDASLNNISSDFDSEKLAFDQDLSSGFLNLSDRDILEDLKKRDINSWDDLFVNINNNFPSVGSISKSNKKLVQRLISDQTFQEIYFSKIKFAFETKQKGESTTNLIALSRNKDSDNKYKDDGYVMDGESVKDASDELYDAQAQVSMNLTKSGTKLWKKITNDNYKRPVAVVLDGVVYTYPVIQSVITDGRCQISGGFDLQEAKDLSNVLKSGRLPSSAVIIGEAVVGPTLGKESMQAGLKSFLIALILVLLYIIFYYSTAGVVSAIALLLNIFFVIGTLASLGAALTLPGIAGIVLTIGMSVDANVLIYERIREELANNKGIKLAVSDGYKHAYSSIIDANVTTLLTGIILFSFGSGPIKGFATTLIIGILTSLFSAIFITRLIISYRLNKGKSISFSNKITHGAFKNLNIDFIGKRKVFYVISTLIISYGAYSLFTKGLNEGIDFTGGRTYVVSFDKEIDKEDLQSELSKVFTDDGQSSNPPTVTEYNTQKDAGYQLKITTQYLVDKKQVDKSNYGESNPDIVVKNRLNKALASFKAKFGDISTEIIQEQKVGPTIADEIRTSAIWAIVFSLIVIFLYILLRFRRWQFSLGAVFAVFHDVLIVLSCFSIFWGVLPFSLEIDQAFVAAVLTIIGYSLNDTVVVFDRVREYMLNFKKKDVHDLLNQSLNSTLSRTINTSLTTLLVLSIIFIFGGDAIKGFMFALMIGVAVGTYSSLFVASPIMMDLVKRKNLNS